MNLPSADQGLQVTEKAQRHIKLSLEQSSNHSAIGIRVGVRKAGCSGFEYYLEYAYPDTQTDLDYCFDYDEIKVVVDKETYLKFLKGGTILDYQQDGLNEGLKFENPNVGNQCGCGESFTLKNHETES